MSAGAAGAAELDRRVVELEDRLELELEQRLEDGLCGCGCGERLPSKGGNGRKRYLDERHRKRYHRDRVKALAKARGVPVQQSIQTLNPSTHTGHRPGDAQRRRQAPQRKRREGVSIYLPTPEAAEAVVDAIRHGRDVELVAESLEPLLELVEAALERRRKRDARATRARTRG